MLDACCSLGQQTHPLPTLGDQRFVICNWLELQGQLTLSGQPPPRAFCYDLEAIRIQ